MKNLSTYVLFMLLICFVVACQESKLDESFAVKPQKSKTGAARRACENTVNYGFIKPDNDYTYNGDGCQSHFIHRGTARYIKIKMSNSAPYAQHITIRFDHPDDYIQYGVWSYTGGSISYGSPVPGACCGAYILWDAVSVPAYTTYELTLSVYGALGTSASENGIQLKLLQPCSPDNSGDCDQDDNMHLLLAD